MRTSMPLAGRPSRSPQQGAMWCRYRPAPPSRLADLSPALGNRGRLPPNRSGSCFGTYVPYYVPYYVFSEQVDVVDNVPHHTGGTAGPVAPTSGSPEITFVSALRPA